MPVIAMSLREWVLSRYRRHPDERLTYHCHGMKLPLLMCSVPYDTKPSKMIAKPFIRTK